MKLKALALIIPALLVAGAAHSAEIYNKDGNKLDLYGKVDARHQFSDNAGDDGDETYVRVGFKGETQISDQLTGYGQWEYNVQANNTENNGTSGNATRLGFAGLKFGDYGSFDYGRNYGVVYDVEAWTDMLPVFGGDSYTYTDNFMVGRANGVATYRNSNFFGAVNGLNFAVQYQGANDGDNNNEGVDGYHALGEGTNNGRDVRHQNGDGYGLSTTYDFGMGISAGAAYASSDRTNDQSADNRGDKADVWTIGAKYDANSVYLATMYSETRNMTPYGDSDIANKTQNFEVTAQYQFDFGLRPEVSYLQSKGKDLNNGNGGKDNDKDLVKYVSVGSYYYFNKNMSAYVDYKINLLDNDDDFYTNQGISTDDVVGVGMVYQF
ncbi:porin OmpC [Rahnella contaminans]|jgi:outer membrane protein N|uniref:porin OmpC n=1 Tax=Rahnella contaminans TaxID=2703882 RepID=UPI001265DDF5|nr:porin OmpC [Rahnella contaminans]KAB8305203.1 porin [Rouxiella chamberiensis]MDF1897057.1 porin OmpC [Rahnella contaminans]